MQEIENKFESNSKLDEQIKNEFVQIRDLNRPYNQNTHRNKLDFFLTSQSSDDYRPSATPTKRGYRTKKERIPMTSPTRVQLEA